MSRSLRICVVTGSRADYGLLYWLMKDIDADRACELRLLVTGMHLAPEFGYTRTVVEADGFQIAETVDMLLAGDSPVATVKSLGLGVIGCADALARIAPDWIVLLGDRFEIFAAAQAGLIMRIPIAHIAGGDVTAGAYDEAIRHSISKMASIHFVTNEQAARRVRQLGEAADRIFNVGSPGLDYLRRMRRLNRAELEANLGIQFRDQVFLVTFHPVTLDATPSSEQFDELLGALDTLDADRTSLIFTRPNADTGGRQLIERLEAYARSRRTVHVFSSLGQERYLSLIAQVDAVIGNSSSGLYEVPSLGKPTVNIGDRQLGRLQAASVVNCPPERDAIRAAIRSALALDCTNVVNPYGDGRSSERILAHIKSIEAPAALLKKGFAEFNGGVA